jgi:hypothetical protein
MSGSCPWTTPAQIIEQLCRYWESGRILAAPLTGASLFPLPLRFTKPGSRALADRFDEVRRWIAALDSRSKAARGFGYEILWADVNHRQLGRNRMPVGLVVPTEQDALELLGKRQEAECFRQLSAATLEEFPALHGWLSKHPLTALNHAPEWPQVLAVVRWFQAHPCPGIYLRQLDIVGVDTKFIESRRGLLAELLDLVLPPEAISATQTGGRDFEQRYGLRSKPVLMRLRLLDDQLRLRLCGFSDITVDVAELAQAPLTTARVIVTENEVNGLALPPLPQTVVMFGGGYALSRLAHVRWLETVDLFYWGDIDTHGFAMLSRFRQAFPRARSLLMDRETLLAHRHLWVREDEHRRFTSPLAELLPVEQELFDELRQSQLGERVRLEQERIAFGWVDRALRMVVSHDEFSARA